ncbi:putative bud site selection protein [Clavispora lusitaniae]|uniref:SH3 domain-containing protein n=2 Tax=Clavispora lusitaniae TaxID=36911 RepID=C4XWW2_CLAL4|nr:uncharacterized protein CLUG_00434 [Clavispora lusitaniae ATCC 42720]KAF7584348.1 hypothetical protein FOB63_000420 [Clavispora lusitaniae]EEQ36311.1 hypothetical protein CLUG_00434 [Clavispora lusitaniae ATCC 42720]QFZ25348.1 putative bud site selection protein [Clavispora lusitaniae]QFZ31349.1 putative bud site selection protein [Clavispora lusitaniae]QFZ37017.1 putative bud site selection protein [Clavispora lusitaniae]
MQKLALEKDDTLESTNRLLHDLERKLSVGSASSGYTATSHGSVVRNTANAGLASHSIQSSVLRYLQSSDFDANAVYADRQQKFATTFGREYSPVSRSSSERIRESDTESSRMDLRADSDERSEREEEMERIERGEGGKGGKGGKAGAADQTAQHPADPPETPEQHYDAVYSDSDPLGDILDDSGEASGDASDASGSDAHSDFHNFDSPDAHSDADLYGDFYDDDFDPLPPSPPRSPPRDLDPAKLYGLYDFSGPDPSHCTLARDEPVVLVDDSDSYWWLVRKMTRAERAELAQKRGLSPPPPDADDGKVGFVPAECLETHVERLARLNCFRNEELERGLLPGRDVPRRAASRKQVTFEGVADLNWDDEDVGFSYYQENMAAKSEIAAGDIPSAAVGAESDVLSDIFSDTPLVVEKRTGRKDGRDGRNEGNAESFEKTGATETGSRESVGKSQNRVGTSEDASTSENSASTSENSASTSENSVSASEYSASTASLNCEVPQPASEKPNGISSGDSAPDGRAVSQADASSPSASTGQVADPKRRRRRRKKPVHDMFSPILGKLDELTEKLAELEHFL